jgi:uncharacterized membrane protein
VGGYVVSGVVILWGLLLAVATLVARQRMQPRPDTRQVVLGVLHGALWVVIGGVLLGQALSSAVPFVPVVVVLGAIVVVVNVLAWPLTWRHLGDPAAWRGEAPQR